MVTFTSIAKWIIAREEIDFADFVKDAKSVAGFLLPSNFESDGMRLHKHGLAARQLQNGGPRSRFFRDQILQNSGHFKG